MCTYHPLDLQPDVVHYIWRTILSILSHHSSPPHPNIDFVLSIFPNRERNPSEWFCPVPVCIHIRLEWWEILTAIDKGIKSAMWDTHLNVLFLRQDFHFGFFAELRRFGHFEQRYFGVQFLDGFQSLLTRFRRHFTTLHSIEKFNNHEQNECYTFLFRKQWSLTFRWSVKFTCTSVSCVRSVYVLARCDNDNAVLNRKKTRKKLNFDIGIGCRNEISKYSIDCTSE